MPKIEKVKKKLNLPGKPRPIKKKTTRSPTHSKHSTIDYYNCLLTQAQNDWFDPQTGKRKKITACCKDCKLKAPSLNSQRQQEIQQLIISYRQVGNSLSKLLRPVE